MPPAVPCCRGRVLIHDQIFCIVRPQFGSDRGRNQYVTKENEDMKKSPSWSKEKVCRPILTKIRRLIHGR